MVLNYKPPGRLMRFGSNAPFANNTSRQIYILKIQIYDTRRVRSIGVSQLTHWWSNLRGDELCSDNLLGVLLCSQYLVQKTFTMQTHGLSNCHPLVCRLERCNQVSKMQKRDTRLRSDSDRNRLSTNDPCGHYHMYQYFFTLCAYTTECKISMSFTVFST